ncbi:MAG: Dyp-type peroxidase family [Paracoccaceae bacterium]|jgi:Dyp-type peroxidase family
MSAPLDLRDIQGNILRAYGRYGYPHARYFLFHIGHAHGGRQLIRNLVPRVTTAERWANPNDPHNGAVIERPKTTLNLALTWTGLRALDLPTVTLSHLPREFIDGMARRSHILSDVGLSAHEHWDEVWRKSLSNVAGADIHMLVSVSSQMLPNGDPVPEMGEVTDWVREEGRQKGVALLKGHGTEGADYQQAGSRLVDTPTGGMRIDGQEHFGYEDGIGNPVFAGQYPPEIEAKRVIGRGKIMPDQSWAPLATGEFLIGHVDESQELPFATQPPRFMHNGTFLAFRKLHENVGKYDQYIEAQAKTYAQYNHVSESEASLTIRAKMVGRWPNGVPLMAAPTYADMKQFEAEWSDIDAIKAKSGNRTPVEQARLDAYEQVLIDFKYRDDRTGARCPISAHIRRGNMRDMLDPRMDSPNPKTWDGSALTNRRRILRRGLPYGTFDPDDRDDKTERGVIFIAMCANLFRQFEFVLQQWINYGLDFSMGNDNCPLLGYHHEFDKSSENYPRAGKQQQGSKFMIQTDPDGGTSPWVLNDLPQFVVARGGDYFFVPSINTLNMISLGVVDPT